MKLVIILLSLVTPTWKCASLMFIHTQIKKKKSPLQTSFLEPRDLYHSMQACTSESIVRGIWERQSSVWKYHSRYQRYGKYTVLQLKDLGSDICSAEVPLSKNPCQHMLFSSRNGALMSLWRRTESYIWILPCWSLKEGNLCEQIKPVSQRSGVTWFYSHSLIYHLTRGYIVEPS